MKNKEGSAWHSKFSNYPLMKCWHKIKKINFKHSKGLSLSAGFTLIESLLALFIFSLITVTFYSIFAMGTGYMLEAKNRLGALSLANEKMEIIRNLNYIDIGTENGIPSGEITQGEDVAVNGKNYHITTLIQYVDDDFDGTGTEDDIPGDYKLAKVTVSWGAVDNSSKRVELISSFSPMSREVVSGNGILAINIADSFGNGISQASVRIKNNYLSPVVDVTRSTDDRGSIMFLEAPPDPGGYELIVSKNGYETVATTDPDSVDYQPVDENFSVTEGYITSASVVINKLSDLLIKSSDNFGNSIPDVNFHLRGGRVLGTRMTVFPPEKVYDLDGDLNTNSSGEKAFDNRSPGTFFLSDWEEISGYTFAGVSSFADYYKDELDEYYTFILYPEEEKEVELTYVSNDENALLVKVLDKNDDLPIAGAEVKLKNEILNFEQIVTTSWDGLALFPSGSEPLLEGDYSLEVKADGFQTNSEPSIIIEGLIKQEIKLD